MLKLIRLAERAGHEARDLRKMVASEMHYNQIASYSLGRPHFALSDRGLNTLTRTVVREQIVDAGYRLHFKPSDIRN